jgi:hypothetical protein
MLRNCSCVEARQSFVESKAYQPIAESALAIKRHDMLGGRVQTIFYSNSGSIRIAKHAVCDKIQRRRYRAARTKKDTRSSAEAFQSGTASCNFSSKFNVDLTLTSEVWCVALFGFLPLTCSWK